MGKPTVSSSPTKKMGAEILCLLAAVTWRDATDQKLGKPRIDRNTVTVSDTTGVVGVHINEKLNRYEVCWVNKDGKQGKTSVSINVGSGGDTID